MESILTQLVQGKALLFIVVLGLGGSFQLGSHLTLISSPSLFIKAFINSSWTQRYGGPPGENSARMVWSAVVSSFALGGLFGAISVRWVTNYLGRKRAMLWNNVINIVASAIMCTCRAANSFEMIMLSRFLFGLATGLGGNIHVLYLGESSPKEIRGVVTLTVATFMAIGKLTGQIMGLSELLGREEFWNILLCVPAFFSLIQMVTLPFFPEAPRYLLIEKEDTDQCRKALQCLWGPGEYEKEIEEMLEEQASLKGERSKTLQELLRDKSVRWQLLTLLVLIEGIQFCGISGISMFSFSIFQEAGIPVDKIRYVTLGVGMSEILTNIMCNYASWIPYSTVGYIFLFIIFYGGGPAGVAPPLSHEMFVQSYRSAAFVLSGFIIWANSSIFGFIFPFLLAELKSLTFLLFSFVCLAASVFFFFILPETKGKTPLEISEDFRNIRVCGSPNKDICLESKL
ncbi:solute carrier family 2, facilitated glucose transporter member 9-like isoform X2 [Brachyhypopomus gauderio]|uniref:solute carrier family 2, facilitated glucose transporter member 9-like isoform X2 n=1 Tax=Brachyhypopomus gauderio TaxID=698409 RepID=UPI0040422E52